MSSWFSTNLRLAATGTLIVGAALAGNVLAQNKPPPVPPPSAHRGPPPAMPSPAQMAIEYRQALYTVLGTNFGPLGGILQGKAPFKPAEVMKSAERVAFLATMVGEAFPEISKSGHTQAKPEIWTHRADFDKKVSALTTSSAALLDVLKRDNSNSPAFKKAAGAVGQACKSCHDDYKQDDE
jgi:cytochrome c556